MKLKILFLLFPICFFGQNFESAIRVTYLLESKDKKDSDEKSKKTFILIANNKNSLFKPAITYVFDSLNISSPNNQEVFQKYYDPNSQEQISFKGDSINVHNTINFATFGYKESQEMNWKILNEKKIILGLECRKATITKFGRNWIAYFSDKYQFPFGPFKFNNLPGLILEIRDDKDEFVFTLRKIINYNKSTSLSNDKKVHYTTKEKYFETIQSSQVDMTMGGKIKFSAETERELKLSVENRLKNINNIEKD